MPNLLDDKALEQVMGKVKEIIEPVLQRNKEIEERIEQLEGRVDSLEE